MFTYIHFIGLVAGVPCGNPIVCQCYLDLGILQCKGGNVTDFPNISKQVQKQILFLDIQCSCLAAQKIGCTCLLYSSGKMICHGSKDQMRKYGRLLCKLGYTISLKMLRSSLV